MAASVCQACLKCATAFALAGDGKSCTDCAGVVHGTAKVDHCGKCQADSAAACKMDCAKQWGGTAKVDACGKCGGDGSTCAGCDGVPKSGAEVDACGVCGGHGDSCADCAGTPNGHATRDHCGTCDAEPKNDCTKDCAGKWGGPAKLDVCGVCMGDGKSCEEQPPQPSKPGQTTDPKKFHRTNFWYSLIRHTHEPLLRQLM
jgi:hypothetical protein|eukprot:SAG25_NODE_713_length_5795_cov_4.798806_4_plen_201_part_00